MTFQGLVYTSSNEDTRYECALLAPTHKRVLAVCGSGARALPLAAIGGTQGRFADELVIVDSNPMQLDFARMRLAAIHDFDRTTYARFLGYEHGCLREERRALFDSLDFQRDAKIRLRACFEAYGLTSPFALGRWETSIMRLSRLIRAAVGPDFLKVFACSSEDEQRDFLASHFASRRWKMTVATLSQSVLLGGVFFRGRLPPLTLSASGMLYYDSVLKTAFANGLARENFFLSFLFRGKYDSVALPCEAAPGFYERMRKALRTCKVTFVQGDLSDTLRRAAAKGEPFDFVSASDVPSYWDANALVEFHAALGKGLSQGGVAVLRHYRHRPEDSKSLKRSGLHDSRYPANANPMECTGLYDISHLTRQGSEILDFGRRALHPSGAERLSRGGPLHGSL
ncbi:MAG: DUF3419 family protein [Silvanigrellales bacterium]|nr:DUF3419 family protein [Silvanigrellales bacterium]